MMVSICQWSLRGAATGAYPLWGSVTKLSYVCCVFLVSDPRCSSVWHTPLQILFDLSSVLSDANRGALAWADRLHGVSWLTARLFASLGGPAFYTVHPENLCLSLCCHLVQPLKSLGSNVPVYTVLVLQSLFLFVFQSSLHRFLPNQFATVTDYNILGGCKRSLFACLRVV